MSTKEYIPALKYPFLTKWYEQLAQLIFKWTSFGTAINTALETLDVKPNQEILDLCCGPGSMAMDLKKKNPSCTVLGVDCDPMMIRQAKENAKKEGVSVQFIEQDITHLNLAQKFDRIYSTLAFHHITPQGKKEAFGKIKTRLKPGGHFVLADFCQPVSKLQRLAFYQVQLFDGFKTTTSHVNGWLENELKNNFKKVKQVKKVSTVVGSLGVFVCE